MIVIAFCSTIVLAMNEMVAAVRSADKADTLYHEGDLVVFIEKQPRLPIGPYRVVNDPKDSIVEFIVGSDRRSQVVYDDRLEIKGRGLHILVPRDLVRPVSEVWRPLERFLKLWLSLRGDWQLRQLQARSRK